MKLSRSTVSFGVALALAAVLDGALVIAKEKSPAVMAALARLTGHHWISHALIVLILFAAGGWLLKGRAENLPGPGLVRIVLAGIGIGSMLIVGFYLTERG